MSTQMKDEHMIDAEPGVDDQDQAPADEQAENEPQEPTRDDLSAPGARH